MTHLHRTAGPALVALLAGLVLTACGDSPDSSVPAPAGSAAAAGQPEDATATPGPVELPWPAHGAADAAALQTAADSGRQPWLLDPSEVAVSYAAAAHGWTDAEAYPGPAGTTVDVRNADGERLTLTLAQPVRTGDGGIWVVTAERPA